MKQSLYLHNDVTDILKTYCGTIENAVDKILTAYDEGLIDIEDKPKCRSREGANRFNVNITNETYLNMVEIYGIKSKRISIRRLLYWFVENEIYDELGWEIVTDFENSIVKNHNRLIENCIGDLTRLKINIVKNVMDGADVVNHAIDLITTLRR